MKPMSPHPFRILILASLSLAAAACCGHRPPPATRDPAIATAAAPASRPAVAQDAFESQVRLLAVGTPELKVDAAVEALRRAGVDAFPTLVAHLSDPTPADDRFGPGDVLPAGPTRTYEICFYLLRSQIEGNWPKMQREFYVLDRANAAWWLAAHPGLSLDQLRHAAHAESLAKARAALAAGPPSDYLQGQVHFLERLQSAPADSED